MKIYFTKMQALGNDFVVIDDMDFRLRRLGHLAKKLCDRRFGIGADQLLLLCHSNVADFRMRIFNADGSEVEMCGNGIRCLGKYILDDVLRCEESPYAKKYCQTLDSLSVETTGGIKYIHKTGNLFRIDMGEPVFDPEKIPVAVPDRKLQDGRVIEYPLKAGNSTYRISCVSMGNPHAVIIVKDINAVQPEKIGPVIENHKLFPNRVNVEFLQIKNRSTILMKVWERGAGATLGCGTGASASAVITSVLGLTGRKVTVFLPGGSLLINWTEKDNHVYMTGPALRVFEGSVEI